MEKVRVDKKGRGEAVEAATVCLATTETLAAEGGGKATRAAGGTGKVGMVQSLGALTRRSVVQEAKTPLHPRSPQGSRSRHWRRGAAWCDRHERTPSRLGNEVARVPEDGP